MTVTSRGSEIVLVFATLSLMLPRSCLRSLLLLSFTLTLMCNAQAAQPPALCTANQLTFSTDSEGGNFNGMSHSGTLAVLRNIGPAACRITPLPRLTFSDAAGKNLGATATIAGARFMHPGPVVLPIIVAPGAEITATLRWVSGEVYDKSVCIEPANLHARFGTIELQAKTGAKICGDAGKPLTFEMSRFATDPVYKMPAEHNSNEEQ